MAAPDSDSPAQPSRRPKHPPSSPPSDAVFRSPAPPSAVPSYPIPPAVSRPSSAPPGALPASTIRSSLPAPPGALPASTIRSSLPAPPGALPASTIRSSLPAPPGALPASPPSLAPLQASATRLLPAPPASPPSPESPAAPARGRPAVAIRQGRRALLPRVLAPPRWSKVLLDTDVRRALEIPPDVVQRLANFYRSVFRLQRRHFLILFDGGLFFGMKLTFRLRQGAFIWESFWHPFVRGHRLRANDVVRFVPIVLEEVNPEGPVLWRVIAFRGSRRLF